MQLRYLYRANWTRVDSGETVILNVDLGLRVHHVGPFRLKDVSVENTADSREALERLLLKAGELRIETHKSLQGEWLTTIFYTNDLGKEMNLNEELVAINVSRTTSK